MNHVRASKKSPAKSIPSKTSLYFRDDAFAYVDGTATGQIRSRIEAVLSDAEEVLARKGLTADFIIYDEQELTLLELQGKRPANAARKAQVDEQAVLARNAIQVARMTLRSIACAPGLDVTTSAMAAVMYHYQMMASPLLDMAARSLLQRREIDSLNDEKTIRKIKRVEIVSDAIRAWRAVPRNKQKYSRFGYVQDVLGRIGEPFPSEGAFRKFLSEHRVLSV